MKLLIIAEISAQSREIFERNSYLIHYPNRISLGAVRNAGIVSELIDGSKTREPACCATYDMQARLVFPRLAQPCAARHRFSAEPTGRGVARRVHLFLELPPRAEPSLDRYGSQKTGNRRQRSSFLRIGRFAESSEKSACMFRRSL